MGNFHHLVLEKPKVGRCCETRCGDKRNRFVREGGTVGVGKRKKEAVYGVNTKKARSIDCLVRRKFRRWIAQTRNNSNNCGDGRCVTLWKNVENRKKKEEKRSNVKKKKKKKKRSLQKGRKTTVLLPGQTRIQNRVNTKKGAKEGVRKKVLINQARAKRGEGKYASGLQKTPTDYLQKNFRGGRLS